MTPETFEQARMLTDRIGELTCDLQRAKKIISQPKTYLLVGDYEMRQDLPVSGKTRDMVYQMCLIDIKDQIATAQQELDSL